MNAVRKMKNVKILTLYKALMRESQKIPAYNFREYALRRIRSSFKDNKNVQSQTEVQNQISYANKQLSLIRRQIILGNLYAPDKLVIESKGVN